jgi:hypothetical protein
MELNRCLQEVIYRVPHIGIFFQLKNNYLHNIHINICIHATFFGVSGIDVGNRTVKQKKEDCS